MRVRDRGWVRGRGRGKGYGYGYGSRFGVRVGEARVRGARVRGARVGEARGAAGRESWAVWCSSDDAPGAARRPCATYWSSTQPGTWSG